jgi:YVTN family beta-propeller protein
LTVAAGLLSAVLLVVAVLLARDGGAPPLPTAPGVLPAANDAVRIDPATYQPVAAVAVGTDPAAVVEGGGLVWVANRRDGTVSVVDPDTNQVQQTISASGFGPVGPVGPGLAFASGSLWLVETGGQVARIQLDEGRRTAIPVGASPTAVVAAPDANAVWVAARTRSGGGLLARIDAESNQVVRSIPVPQAPSGLTVTPDGRTVWLATGSGRVLYRVDVSAGHVVGHINLKRAADQVAFGEGAVWVTSRRSDAVLRVNPATSRVQPPISVGNGPTGIAVGAGQVWVANADDGTVSTIDPQSNEVGTMRLGFRPEAVAVDQGAVWVALAA